MELKSLHFNVYKSLDVTVNQDNFKAFVPAMWPSSANVSKFFGRHQIKQDQPQVRKECKRKLICMEKVNHYFFMFMNTEHLDNYNYSSVLCPVSDSE